MEQATGAAAEETPTLRVATAALLTAAPLAAVRVVPRLADVVAEADLEAAGVTVATEATVVTGATGATEVSEATAVSEVVVEAEAVVVV